MKFNFSSKSSHQLLQSRDMTSYVRSTHEIGQKLKVPPPPDRILLQKGKEVFRMTKITIFREHFAISGSFDEKRKK